MLGSIKYNLANIFNFHGRDARPTFWYYVLFLFILQVAIGMIAAIPMYVDLVSGAVEAVKTGASEQNMEAAMFGRMSGQMHTQMLVSVVIGAVSSVLFSAAFVRRLHDSGKPGWWLLLVLVPYLASLIISVMNFDTTIALTERMVTATDPDQRVALQSQLYQYSLLGWIAYIPVLVFGLWKSDPGPNRYGEEPVRF